MLEQWLVELGAVLQQSIYEDGVYGYATFASEKVDGAVLRLRYDWETLHIGWSHTFDRWANSVDWYATATHSKNALSHILDEAVYRGVAGQINDEGLGKSENCKFTIVGEVVQLPLWSTDRLFMTG